MYFYNCKSKCEKSFSFCPHYIKKTEPGCSVFLFSREYLRTDYFKTIIRIPAATITTANKRNLPWILLPPVSGPTILQLLISRGS